MTPPDKTPAEAPSSGPDSEVRPRILMICVNRRFRMDEPSCAARGSEDMAKMLEETIRQRRINIVVERSVCMGHCPTGPTIRLAPGGRFYHGPADDEISAILDDLERLCGVKDEAEDGPPMHLLGS